MFITAILKVLSLTKMFYCFETYIAFLGLCGSVVEATESSCPSLYKQDSAAASAAQSGVFSQDQTCFLDCTRDDEFDLICENVMFLDLVQVLTNVPEWNRSVNVLIWSSPNVVELEGGIFAPIQSRLRSLRLQNMDNLINFPSLRDLSVLKTLIIEIAGSLRELSLELLPRSLEKLVIVRTGISTLTVDLQEVQPFPNVGTFIFMQHNIKSISDKFFDVFPNMSSLRVAENNFTLIRIPEDFFDTQSPMQLFLVQNNNFSQCTSDITQHLIETLIEVTSVQNNTSIDMSNNNVPITRDAIAALASINRTKQLSLSGNNFGQFFDTSGMFSGFDNLQRLDLSNSNLPKQTGLLRGLSGLKMLDLSKNNFRDLSRVDLFAGCQAQLDLLDLSDNILMALPAAGFLNLTKFIRTIKLSGNRFHSPLLGIKQENLLPAPLPPRSDWSSLTTLILSKTELVVFKGSWVSNMSRLTSLDVSCNRIRRITKEFFAGLPSSLATLDMSFCTTNMPEAPRIEEDAFSALGANLPRSISKLILRSGFFKTWILKRLLRMPRSTRTHLISLDLSRNQIRYISQSSLVGFDDLRELNLGENYIQSIGQRTFSVLYNLRSLNLSSNRIVSVQQNELVDMPSLTFLDLSNNGLLMFSPGSLDSLTGLTRLYLGRNRLSSPLQMFQNGGKNLVHLGIQRIPNVTLNTYPVGCIDRTDLNGLPSLKYFYVDNSTAVFVDQGTSSQSLEDQMRSVPVQPEDPFGFQCYYGGRLNAAENDVRAVQQDDEPDDLSVWTNDFTRIVVSDPTDLTARTFYANIPKCFSYSFKFVANATTNFICPNKDSKVYDMTSPAHDPNASP